MKKRINNDKNNKVMHADIPWMIPCQLNNLILRRNIAIPRDVSHSSVSPFKLNKQCLLCPKLKPRCNLSPLYFTYSPLSHLHPPRRTWQTRERKLFVPGLPLPFHFHLSSVYFPWHETLEDRLASLLLVFVLIKGPPNSYKKRTYSSPKEDILDPLYTRKCAFMFNYPIAWDISVVINGSESRPIGWYLKQ